MKLLNLFHISFHKKLIAITILIILISTIAIGYTAYTISKDMLSQKDEVVLKNAVTQALNLIELENEQVALGIVTEAEAKERIKTYLLGPLNPDGSRALHHNVDLGEQGYFIVYDAQGNEIMHPTLEGQNVWDVVDFSDEQHYLVQEQIDKGLNGGGFVYYDWMLPHSDEVEEKISYSEYDPNWEWIVVSTMYSVDFNKQAKIVFNITLISIVVIVTITSIIANLYVNRMIKPILMVSNGMEAVCTGQMDNLDLESSEKEVSMLIKGYNSMVNSLNVAQNFIDEKNKKLEYLAYYDSLTGLANFHGALAYFEGKSHLKGFLVQMDLIGLKAINSTLGHDQGDHVLKLISQYFTDQCEEKCFVSRTSSNEFTIWLEGDDLEYITERIEYYKNHVGQYLSDNDFHQMVDFYIVMTDSLTKEKSFNTLYEEVTLAMRLAKKNNIRKVFYFEKDMKGAVERDLQIKKYLKTAIEQNQIIPHYQEKVDFKSNCVVGVEALARWYSDELGYVPPNEFIPAISEGNMMSEFTEKIIDRVFSDYPRLVKKYGSHVTVSVNISPTNFKENDFFESIKQALIQKDMPAEKLILEITEDVLIDDYQTVCRIIDQLHDLGVKISIDDFGTGYSSLNYLLNINFDEMKIDKSFMDQIPGNPRVNKLFKLICDIAALYNYDIVAEGVETQEQLKSISDTLLIVK